MTPPSNETLNYALKEMERQRKEDRQQNANEHNAVLKIMNEIQQDIKGLENKFVMRREFKVAVGLVSVFATILGIIGFFIGN